MLAGLFFGAAGRSLAREEEAPSPAPLQAVDELNIVISEFRFLGPEGGNDEFIELFNRSGRPININGWKIMGASSDSNGSNRKTITYAPDLEPGQHYLLVNEKASAGLISLKDDTYKTGITEDGGIALTLADETTIIDQVGLSVGTVYKEGTPLTPLKGTANQSYERKNAGNIYNCADTDNNTADFVRNAASINPQNLASPYTPCLVVTDVRSTSLDATYFPSQTIDIKVTFSSNVNVTGVPELYLETGLVDTPALYSSGSGSNELIFKYTVAVGDSSVDLDYVNANSLKLDGDSITGAIGNATLILPKPGPNSTGSLGYNNNIKVDNDSQPTVLSIKRQHPLTTTTDADMLTFRVSFSEAVTGVDNSDFMVHPNTLPEQTTTAIVKNVNPVSKSIYDVTVSEGNLAGFNGTVGLDLNAPTIQDLFGMNLLQQEPSVDETYTVNNSFTVTVERAQGQLPTDDTTPVNFAVEFSQPINVSTFTVADITPGGTASFIAWSITDSGDHKKFALSAVSIGGNGTLAPSISAGKVNNVTGLGNQASTTVTLDGNVVNFLDNVRPAVTVKREVNQPATTNELPIRFIVEFSEPINSSTFTVSDITQQGEATGITWSLVNSGDNKKFKLSATASEYGTLKPIIEANRVLDLIGLNNTESQSPNLINQVDYQEPLSVTVDQASKQQDPTIDLPIAFTVKFSETINPGTFTVEDIVQKGTVTGIKWYIENSGNNMVFTLRATDADADSYGTIIPFIPANRVKNEDGSLENLASVAAADGSVTYVQGTKSVVISEVAWMGTQANSSHEWIELFNTTRKPISLDGWRLISFRWSGTQFVKNLDIALKGVISPRTSTLQNNTSGYFLLVANENAVSFPGTSETYDQKYTGSLYNTGEILLLCSTYNIQVAKNCDENHKTLLVDFVNARSRTGTIRPWPAGSSTIYGSMERQDWRSDDVTAYFTHTGANPHFGFDANGNFIKGTPKYPNWAFTVTSTPRPTALPTRTATPKPGSPPVLVLNEVMARAGTDWNADGRVDVYDEFIEVINAGTSNLSLSSYKLSLASAPAAVFSLPSQTLKPGERMVFYGSQSGLQLKDSGDTVRLLRASNNSLVDAVAYPIAKVLDASVCRYADGYGSWIVGCYPTPGLANALTGGRFPLPVGGQPVCHLPDSTPWGFVLAECEETGGSGMWNPAYWDSFPGEGQEVWISDPHNKWLAVYQ